MRPSFALLVGPVSLAAVAAPPRREPGRARRQRRTVILTAGQSSLVRR